MSTIDPGRHPGRQRGWAAWFTLLGVAGAWMFATAPAERLRDGWGAWVSLAWVFTMASCGVAVEALWNGRAYRQKAMLAVLWGTLLIWVLVLYLGDGPAIVGAPAPVLIALTVSSFVLVTTPSKHP